MRYQPEPKHTTRRWQRGLTVLVLATLLVAGFASQAGGDCRSLRPLLDALHMVESSGRLSPDPGDGGRALGPYQIWRVYWTDALEHAPELGGQYQDVCIRAYAEWVMVAYWSRYCPRAIETMDYRTLAVTHHLGPHPDRRPARAKAYWRKVQAALKANTD